MKRTGRKGVDCIIAIQLWEAYTAQFNFYFEKLCGILTSCRTVEVILDYLKVHVNFYVL